MSSGESAPRHTARLASLVILRHGDSILLKRHALGGDRFAGLWNGLGGHIEAGEDILAGARRELREESGLEPEQLVGHGLVLRAVIHESALLGHAYVVFVFVGECASPALRPPPGAELRWQGVDRLAELPLVHDLLELIPRLLSAEEPFFVTETYDGRDRPVAFSVDGEAVRDV